MTAISDRAAAALDAARAQAMRNGNMGQLDGYRRNHVVILAERIQAEERERCARIADEYATRPWLIDPGADVARLIAVGIRDGRDPMDAAPVPDLEGPAEVAEAERMAELPKGGCWEPILTIKVARSGTLWTAWSDDVKGLLVPGRSLAEVLVKFPAAKAELQRARAEAEPHG